MKFFENLYQRIVTYADKHPRMVLAVSAGLLLFLNPVFMLVAFGIFVLVAYIKNEKPDKKV